MITIYLQDLQFNSFHGLFVEEKILGNQFIVNATVKYLPKTAVIIDIDDTINYQNIFDIIEKRMLIATELLETLSMNIANDVLNNFLAVQEVEICIVKKNPPIKNFIGNVAVSFCLKRSK